MHEAGALKMYDGQTWHVIGHIERQGFGWWVWTRNDGTSGVSLSRWLAAQALSAPYDMDGACTP